MPSWQKKPEKSSGKYPEKWHTDDEEPSDADSLTDHSDDDQSFDAVDEVLQAIAELKELLLKLLTKPSAASVN